MYTCALKHVVAVELAESYERTDAMTSKRSAAALDCQDIAPLFQLSLRVL